MPDELPARDRLPRWLFLRYGPGGRWEDLDQGDRIEWQEHADRVIAAVVELAPYRIVPR